MADTARRSSARRATEDPAEAAAAAATAPDGTEHETSAAERHEERLAADAPPPPERLFSKDYLQVNAVALLGCSRPVAAGALVNVEEDELSVATARQRVAEYLKREVQS